MKDRTFTTAEAKKIATQLGMNLEEIDIDEFRRGLAVELEHGSRDPQTNITYNNILKTGKIAWAHLKEIPDYYTRLYIMEHEELRKEKAMKRLYLSNDDKKIFGLCGGLAEYFETDPTLIRLSWIVITIITGIVPGVIAYFVAAMVVPSHPATESERRFSGAQTKA